MQYFLTVILIILNIALFAQKSDDSRYQYPYAFGCESGFYQLINNQLNLLSVNHKGLLAWYPILPPFEQKIGAISYNIEDGFLYGIATETFEIIRIYQSGTLESLGIPRHKRTKTPLDTKLEIGELAGNIFCAYAAAKDSLYWIDITTNTFTLSAALPGVVLTSLAYHPTQEVFYTIGAGGTILALDPYNKATDELLPIMGIPTDALGMIGNFWITSEGRLFATKQKGQNFHELNEKFGVLFTSTLPLPESIGDGTSCSNAAIPVLLEEELLEFKADLPNKGRIMLRWIGAQEQTNSKYVVEQSFDNKFWFERETKPATLGAINQNPYGSLIPYHQNEGHYYRLRKEHGYGKIQYSRTILSEWDTTQQALILSPQVVTDNKNIALYISGYNNNTLDIQIQNQYGQLVKIKQQQILTNEITISLSVEKLAKGMYYLVVNTTNGVERRKFFLM